MSAYDDTRPAHQCFLEARWSLASLATVLRKPLPPCPADSFGATIANAEARASHALKDLWTHPELASALFRNGATVNTVTEDLARRRIERLADLIERINPAP